MTPEVMHPHVRELIEVAEPRAAPPVQGISNRVTTFARLANFAMGSSSGMNGEKASDGHFYGTTSGGPTGRDFEAVLRGAPTDTHSLPSVFRMSAEGKVTTLCRLPGGAREMSALLDSSDGAFYGTMADGGSFGAGAVFRLTKSCSLTILHSFSRRSVAGRPHSGLLRTRDGSLWGTTAVSGRGGTIYRIVP